MASDNFPGNVVRAKSAVIAENGAGTYNFDVFIPAGAIITNIFVAAEVLWTAATSATLKVGDYAVSTTYSDGGGSPYPGSAIDDDGFFTGVNLKATDLTQGQHLDFAHPGGKQGAYLPFPDPTAASLAAGSDIHMLQISDGVDRILRFTVTSVGAGTAGRTFCAVTFIRPTEMANITQ